MNIQEIKNNLLEKLKDKDFIDITQEGDMLIAWYNEGKNTRCIIEEIKSDE